MKTGKNTLCSLENGVLPFAHSKAKSVWICVNTIKQKIVNTNPLPKACSYPWTNSSDLWNSSLKWKTLLKDCRVAGFGYYGSIALTNPLFKFK